MAAVIEAETLVLLPSAKQCHSAADLVCVAAALWEWKKYRVRLYAWQLPLGIASVWSFLYRAARLPSEDVAQARASHFRLCGCRYLLYHSPASSQSVIPGRVSEQLSLCCSVRNPFPPSEKVLFRFQTDKDVARWKVFTDQDYGGRTTACLQSSQQHSVSQLAQ